MRSAHFTSWLNLRKISSCLLLNNSRFFPAGIRNHRAYVKNETGEDLPETFLRELGVTCFRSRAAVLAFSRAWQERQRAGALWRSRRRGWRRGCRARENART